jgi:hypothetical protein
MSTMVKNPPELTADRPRRRLIGWVAAAVVLAVGAAAAAVVLANLEPAEPALAPPPVVLPVPTPTVQAVEREKATAFQQALPDAVLAFSVAGQVEDIELVDAGATEAYVLTYTDGAVDVTLRTSQWPGVEAAAAAAMRLGAAAVPSDAALGAAAADADADAPGDGAPTAVDPGEPIEVREEPVLVGGVEVGRLVISGRALEARAVWSNGATVFELRGPGAVVPPLYDAFPM